MKNKTVIIGVYGGVASVIQSQKGVTVIIKDHDHKREYANIDGYNFEGKDLFKV
jgi:hypothetical protein